MIGYCDDDNILLTNHVEVLIKNLKKEKIVFSNFYVVKVFEEILRNKNSNSPRYKSYFEWLNRDLYDITNHGDIGNFDMLTCGHHKDIVEKHGNWKTVGEIGSHHEDNVLMESWRKQNIKIKYVDNITAIYFGHQGCNGSVKKYKNEYLNYIKKKYLN